MFDWLGEVISGAFDTMSQSVSSVLVDLVLKQFYAMIYNAISEFFVRP